jgi:signal transduction histidine kinase
MPFFTTKKDVGTGLGLWVTKSMVEKHGGTIRFRSTEGHGTVFSIVLPARMSGQNHQSHTAA